MKSITILFLLGLSSLFAQVANATDCNSNCEKHFNKWYQKPDLARCKAERLVACKYGITHCDIYTFDPNRIQITATIQALHNKKNIPKNVNQCYQAADLGFVGYGAGSTIYNWAVGTATTFDPYSFFTKEIAKQVMRCGCAAVRW